MRIYDTVVIGASAFGIGHALRRPEGTLLLESAASLASEYIGSLHCGRHAFPPLSGAAEALREECLRRGLLTADGRFSPFPIASLLAERLLDSRAGVRFLATVTKAVPADGGWIVTWVDAQGFHSVRAMRVVDTTVRTGGQKALNALIVGPEERFAWQGCSQAQVFETAAPGERILRFPLPEETTWQAARETVHSAWERHPAEGWRMASVASAFDWEYPAPYCQEVEPGRLVCAASSFPDLLVALQEGAACAIRH